MRTLLDDFNSELVESRTRLKDRLDTLQLIANFHMLKFNVDSDTQYRKLLEEINEFYCATNMEDKIDECCDIIISAIGYLERNGGTESLIHKFRKVLERPYPDNFQHKD